MRGERQPVRADLVRDVAVGSHAVAADDHRVDCAGRDQPGRGAVDDQLVPDVQASELVHRQPSSLQQWARFGGEDMVEQPTVGEFGNHRERRSAAGRRERAGVAVRQDPAGAGQAGRPRGPRSQRWRLPPPPRSRVPRAARRQIGRCLPQPPHRVHDRPPRVGSPPLGVRREGSRRLARRRRPRVREKARRRRRKPRRHLSAGRPGSPGGGLPRPRPRRSGVRALARSHGRAVWSIAHSAAPSKRSATTLAGDARVAAAMGRCYPDARGVCCRGQFGPTEGRLKGASIHLRLLIPLVLAALCVPANAALAAGGPIMPLSQVQPGMQCTGETVVQGTTISSFNVDVIDVVEAPGEGARILVQVSGPVVDTTASPRGTRARRSTARIRSARSRTPARSPRGSGSTATTWCS